ncbi:MAG TPA: hydrogenase expression/formation protein HypE [Bacteroidales bacterium]|nr:MAG: hydrogenase expression/formation protein HypE [Bacteroidetes bacterium GWF2_33_38]HBF89090.1 hydrogenase expression/formation protein HypE [Bacteroidales bacterium]
MKKVLLGHGSGGELSHNLISDLFIKYFKNPILEAQTDSALLEISSKNISFTTDSYVVDPIFFKGGNIGKLAICGTVNDLAVSGATPKYISCSFIIEEGFSMTELETIVKTMADEAKKAEIQIVTGDTKVVNKGKCDKIFINTSGIGILDAKHKEISSGKNIAIGDKILINGDIADHGMTIMAARDFENFTTNISTDSACLNHLIHELLEANIGIKFMRDATRGGVATVLCELAKNANIGLEIDEENIPVNESVKGLCEVFGFDPLYVANEGKVIIVVDKKDSEKAIKIMQQNEFGKNSAIIGEITESNRGKAWLKTEIGGKRIIDMLAGEQLPRIC